MRCAIATVIKKTPSQLYSQRINIEENGKVILDRATENETKITAFDHFSVELVSCLKAVIADTVKKYKSNASKRERLWMALYQIRTDPKSKPPVLWNELLQCLGISITDPLLEQSIYTEVFECM